MNWKIAIIDSAINKVVNILGSWESTENAKNFASKILLEYGEYIVIFDETQTKINYDSKMVIIHKDTNF